MAITESGFTVDIPGTSAATVLNDVSMTDKTKSLIGMVNDGTALVNPVASGIASLTSAITSATTSVASMKMFEVSASSVGFQVGETLTGGTSGATGVFSEFIGSTNLVKMTGGSGTFAGGETITGGTSSATASTSTSGVPAALTAILGSLNTSNNNFKSHTDRVSGVVLPTGANQLPGMSQVVGVANSITNIKNGLNTLQNDPCGQLALMMAGVILGPATVAEALVKIQSMIADIQSGIRSISLIYSEIQSHINKINNIIANADSYYNTALGELALAAQAQIIEALFDLNPCFAQIYNEVVGTETFVKTLKGIVT